MDKKNNIKDRILEGLELTFHKLVEHKKARNLDFVISKNGKPTHVKPSDILIK